MLSAVFGGDIRHALYLMKNQKRVEAIRNYRAFCREKSSANYEILRELALLLLEQGIKSDDQEMRMLAAYGAGLSASCLSVDILEQALYSSHPKLQLIAVFFLSQIQDDTSSFLLEKAASSSDFLATRVEACYHMALRKERHATSYTESLMALLPPFFRPFFPQFFAAIGTPSANAALRKLLQDPNPMVRVQSILSLVECKRDDFLPMIRIKLTHRNLAEMEACAYALGVFEDAHSLKSLQALSHHSSQNVRIAALLALHRLGDTSKAKEVELAALCHDLFAIQALSYIQGSEDALFELTKAKNREVRANAAIALLKRQDPSC